MNEYGNNAYGGFSDQSASPKSQSKGLAITTLVLAIVGLLTFWCAGFGAVLAIVAIILAIINLCAGKAGKGLAIAGLIISMITVIITGSIIAVAKPMLTDLVENADQIVEDYEEDGTVPEWLEKYQQQYPEEVKQFMDAFVQGYEQGKTGQTTGITTN